MPAKNGNADTIFPGNSIARDQCKRSDFDSDIQAKRDESSR